jgi:TonB family protein
MHRKDFRMSLRRIATKLVFALVSFVLMPMAISPSESGAPEDMRISYFVAPEYPRVARQLMQSGDVVVRVTVDTSGRPTDILVQGPHVLLGESAKATVSKWRFVPPPSTRNTSVFFHYGFSGTPRDCNPSTVVTVDLQAPRVTVTVDPLPPFGPDAFPSSPQKKP